MGSRQENGLRDEAVGLEDGPVGLEDEAVGLTARHCIRCRSWAN
jgi:hypothetical protein